MSTIAFLDGDGVRLRPWRPGDAAAVDAVRDDPIVGRWSSIAVEAADAWIERRLADEHNISLVITEPGEDVAVGCVALAHHELGARRAELSYWLIPERRGRGLVVAACRALCGWAFEHLALDTIVLGIDVDNPPSHGVARALGAVRAPGPPNAEIDRAGVPRDVVTYSLAADSALGCLPDHGRLRR